MDNKPMTPEEEIVEAPPVQRPPETVEVPAVGNPLQQNPVLVSAIVSILLSAGAYYGLDLDAGEMTALVSALMLIAGIVARQFVTPTKRADAAVDAAWVSVPGRDAKPTI